MIGRETTVLRHLDGRTYQTQRLSDCWLLWDGSPQGIMIRLECATEVEQR